MWIPDIHQIFRHTIDAVWRNDVPRKILAGRRIFDRGDRTRERIGWIQEFGQIACSHLLRWNRRQDRLLFVSAVSFESRKEERTVLVDRAAERSAELIAIERLLVARIEEVLRIHFAVAIELEGCAVQFIGSGLRCDDDLSARMTAVFG